MSNTSITYLVAACTAVFSLAAFAWWVAVPAWRSYTRVWERLTAVALSFYVLAAMIGAGVGVGLLFAYYYDHIFK
jgi:hypothetical protein